MSERDIEFLIDLYDKPYVKGEKRSTEYDRKIRHDAKLKNRYLILDELLTEAKPFTLTPTQVKLVKCLIRYFNNKFKDLHRQASEETIILGFMFYAKKLEDSRIKVSNYRVCTEYGLTSNVFEIILCNLALEFMKRCPIEPYKTSSYDNHDVLVRSGKR